MRAEIYNRDQVAKIVSTVVNRIQFLRPMDEQLIKEAHMLQEAIQKVREDIGNVHPGEISHRISPASTELDAVVTTTESATNEIMDACEEIQRNLKDKALQESALIEAQVIRIIEACAFQDLTGQRIAKILNMLEQIDQRAGSLAQVLDAQLDVVTPQAGPVAGAVSLINGPSLPGGGISQEEIDKLLNDF